MKNVLHISSAITWRGGEQQVDFMVNHNSSDFEYFLFCPGNAELTKRNQTKSANIFTYKKRFGFDIFGALELKKVCTKNKIDLIHLHDSHAINTYLISDLFGMNIPAVINRHVNFRIAFKWKYSYRKIQKIICVSEEVKRNLSSFIDIKKLVVIHPGINVGKFQNSEFRIQNYLKQELNLSDEIKIIGIVSALEKEKNIGEFINLANKLIEKNENYHFVIIGDGSLKSEFTNTNTQIHFLGFRNNIPEILSSLDIFLFTSKNEGFPLVILEAMASKIPVVCNNFPSSNELIQNKKTGFIYKDVNQAVKLIEQLLTTYNLRLTTITNAYKFVQQFDVTLMNEKIEQVYKTIFING